MSKAVAKVVEEAKDIVIQEAPAAGEDILSSAIVIPRLLLMQGLSDFVNERKAQQGDIVRKTPFQVLGGPEKPVSFIPITFNNQWMLSELEGVGPKAKFAFRGYEKMDASNQDLPWEFEKNGTQWKRTKVLNLYALLPADIAAEKAEMAKAAKGEEVDPDKALLPVLISFRSTSYTAGKDIVTHFAKARKFAQPGYVSVLTLGCTQDTNEHGTFFIYQIGRQGPAAQDQKEVAAYWHKILSTQAVQVEADESEAPAQAAKVGAGSKF